MPSDKIKFTLRIEPELLKKFRYVAEYNDRSANRELEVLMRKHVANFEIKKAYLCSESVPIKSTQTFQKKQ